ncbi:MAG: hypothetical protein AAF213_03825 [Pseudomonadota bacterium]
MVSTAALMPTKPNNSNGLRTSSTRDVDDVYYQTHALRGGIWLVDQANLDRRQLGAVLDNPDDALADADAYRVVRVVVDRKTKYPDQTIVHFWPDDDDSIDMAMPAVGKPADILWHDDDDLHTDLARYQLGQNYGSFLKSNHLSVEELLHHPAGGQGLVNSWQAMQGGLQPIAMVQAQTMELEAPERVRELTDMLQAYFDKLAAFYNKTPPQPITPETYPGLVNGWLESEGRGATTKALHALCQHIAECKTFSEKLGKLARLADQVALPEQAEPLDRLLASQVSAQGFLTDIAAGRSVMQWLGMLASMMVGAFDGSKGIGVDFTPINELIMAGYLPRMKAAIRRRIIVEARSIGGSAMGDDLIAELSEIDRTSAQLEQLAPALVGDPELSTVWQHRIGRVLTADNVQRVLVRYRQPTERLSVVSSLFPMMRNLNNRNQLGRLIASQLSIPEIARELATGKAKGASAVQPLLKFHQRLAGYQFDDQAKDTILAQVDDHIISVIDRQLQNGGDPLDRVIGMLKLWLPAPMDRGKSRARVEAALQKTIQEPEFFNRFWDSFRSEKVRRQAHEALERLLHDYGLKSKDREHAIDRNHAGDRDTVDA